MIALYRKGNTHKIRGIPCEIGRFKPTEAEFRLTEGWLRSPEELNPPKVKPKKSIEVKSVLTGAGNADAKG